MDKILILRVFVALLVLFALFFTFPILIALIYREYEVIPAFLIPELIIILCGMPIIALTKNHRGQTNLKQGLLLVPLCWITVSIVGSIPYMLSSEITHFSAAVFESSSGLTTTGASVLTNIEAVSKTILFWRALTHWLGGMGIVVLTVALFPQVGIGGNIMLAAESPSPTLEKITPRINEMAKIFWVLYTALTTLQTILLIFGGMNWFDSITHSFATLATGGFSTQNNSIATYAHSPYIQTIFTIFMILAGINYAIYFAVITGNFAMIWKDSELKLYLFLIFGSTLLILINLMQHTRTNIFQALLDSAFQTTTIITTTGFASVDFEQWPYMAQGILFLLMFIGGCAGSTGGGVKVIRISVILKYIRREVNKFFSPMRIQKIKINKKIIDEDYIKLVIFFVACYAVVLLITTLVITFDNHDILTSFTTALATLGNIGPGFGNVGPTESYTIFAPWLKIFLSLVMITGRLELFTVLIIFSPKFWK